MYVVDSLRQLSTSVSTVCALSLCSSVCPLLVSTGTAYYSSASAMHDYKSDTLTNTQRSLAVSSIDSLIGGK